MSDPEEIPTESESGESPPPPAKILPFPARPRPEWLTGPADDVLAANAESSGTPEPTRLPEPVLIRPGVGPMTVPAPQRPEADEPRPERTAERIVERAEPAPRAKRDEPETRAEQGEPRTSPGATPCSGAWAPAASSIPILKVSLPEEPVRGEESDAPTVGRPRGLPGAEEDRKVAPAPIPLEPLREAWWLVAADALRSDWRVQSAVAAALLGLGVLGYALWPHGMDSTPIRSMRQDPRGFDGRTVLVRGRVGDDVFSVGSGWAFYLTQGRDTIVAFTRTGAPRPHQVVSVKGTVTTGFLDGQPRQALFEGPGPAK